MKNSKAIDELTNLILNKGPLSNSLALVGISGAAALGKSSLATAIRNNIASKAKKKVDILPTDAFLLPRQERHDKDISGYDPRATDINKINGYLKNILEGKSVKFRPYDHSTGKIAQQMIVINPHDIVIVDGIHSYHTKFRRIINYKIFLDAERELAIRMRSIVDASQRGYAHNVTLSTAYFEHKNYEVYIHPYIKYADVVVRVHENWIYEIVN